MEGSESGPFTRDKDLLSSTPQDGTNSAAFIADISVEGLTALQDKQWNPKKMTYENRRNSNSVGGSISARPLGVPPVTPETYSSSSAKNSRQPSARDTNNTSTQAGKKKSLSHSDMLSTTRGATKAPGGRMGDASDAELLNYRRIFDAFDTAQEGKLRTGDIPAMMQCLGMTFTVENMAQHLKDMEILKEDTVGFPSDLEKLASTSVQEIEQKAPTLNFAEFAEFMRRCSEDDENDELQTKEAEHIKWNSKRFDPGTFKRWCWDTLILFITLYFCMRVTLEWTNVRPFWEGTTIWIGWGIEIILSFVLLADVVCVGNTAFIDRHGLVVENLTVILKQYFCTWGVFDVLGAFPFDFFVFLAKMDPDDMANYIHWTPFVLVRALRLLRVLRIARLYSSGSVTGVVTPRMAYLQLHISPIIVLAFFVVSGIHLLITLWLIVQGKDAKIIRSTDVNVLTLEITYQADADEWGYLDGLYFILCTLSTVGYGDIYVAGIYQRLYCTFLFICAAVVNGIVISQVSSFLQKANIMNERRDKLRETLAVLDNFDIPSTTQSEILSFQRHLLEHNLGSSHTEVISSLPPSLQHQLALYGRIKYISMVSLFSSGTQECKIALAKSLKSIIYRPQEFIIIAGEIGQEMYFLGYGVADVIHPTAKHIATLRAGNFFGEIALCVPNTRRTASVKALTYCELFRLQLADFRNILSLYPAFKDSVEIEIQQRVKALTNTGSALPWVKAAPPPDEVLTKARQRALSESEGNSKATSVSASPMVPRRQSSSQGQRSNELVHVGSDMVPHTNSAPDTPLVRQTTNERHDSPGDNPHTGSARRRSVTMFVGEEPPVKEKSTTTPLQLNSTGNDTTPWDEAAKSRSLASLDTSIAGSQQKKANTLPPIAPEPKQQQQHVQEPPLITTTNDETSPTAQKEKEQAAKQQDVAGGNGPIKYTDKVAKLMAVEESETFNPALSQSNRSQTQQSANLDRSYKSTLPVAQQLMDRSKNQSNQHPHTEHAPTSPAASPEGGSDSGFTGSHPLASTEQDRPMSPPPAPPAPGTESTIPRPQTSESRDRDDIPSPSASSPCESARSNYSSSKYDSGEVEKTNNDAHGALRQWRQEALARARTASPNDGDLPGSVPS